MHKSNLTQAYKVETVLFARAQKTFMAQSLSYFIEH